MSAAICAMKDAISDREEAPVSFTSNVERSVVDGTEKAKIKVVVEAKKVDEAINREFKSLAKQLRFPGFRQGKAPRSVIEGQVGREYVLAQALEELVNETYPLAVDAQELRTAGKVDFKDPAELVEGADYEYLVEVDLRPEYALTSTEVEITMVPKEATDAEIDAQVTGTLERFATFPVVEDADAVVADDSFVTLSFESSIDGDSYEGSSVSGELYQLGQGMMPAEFDAGLLGAKAGESREIEFTVEDTGANTEFAGKTMKMDVTVDALNQRVLPEVDDDFAKQTGFDTVEAMRAEIKTYIESQKAQQWDRMRDDRLLEELIGFLDGEVPQSLIEARADSMLDEFSRMLEQQNLTLDAYLEQANIDPEQYQADMEIQAGISVANDLALESLAREKGLVPDDEALEEEFTKAAEADDESDMSAKDLRETWVKRGLLTTLRDDIARSKAFEWLRDNAIINTEDLAATATGPEVVEAAAETAGAAAGDASDAAGAKDAQEEA